MNPDHVHIVLGQDDNKRTHHLGLMAAGVSRAGPVHAALIIFFDKRLVVCGMSDDVARVVANPANALNWIGTGMETVSVAEVQHRTVRWAAAGDAVVRFYDSHGARPGPAPSGATDLTDDMQVVVGSGAFTKLDRMPATSDEAVRFILTNAGGAAAVFGPLGPRPPRALAPSTRTRAQLARADRIRGSLLAGAVGDALGAPVEFLSAERIQQHFGPAGITDLAPAYDRVGAFTDDTQMTLFTAEGLIRAEVRGSSKGIVNRIGMIDRAYARWLQTQGATSSRWPEPDRSGWLVNQEALHHRRAPGNTCLEGLSGPLPVQNNSKGCGGVMRVAPIGLVGRARAFEVATESARLSHGHPTGQLAAGVLAELLAQILDERPLLEVVDEMLDRLDDPSAAETRNALRAARHLAEDLDAEPGPEAIKRLGRGWLAEEALAISVYCALVAPDLRSALLLAVNHDGDSDSTGAITGNLVGALSGTQAIPVTWVEQLELRDVIEQVADDLAKISVFGGEPDELADRYLGF